MTLLVVALLCATGVVGGYGLGRAVDGVRGMLAGPESLPADKVAAPEPINAGGPWTTCTPDAVELRLSSSATTVTAGSPMSFMVRVTNVGRVPCTFNGTAASRAVTIVDAASKERVWSSSDCADGSRLLLLGPGDLNAGEVHWKSQTSGKGCKGQPTVPAGTYEATASLVDVPGAKSDPVTFTVAAKAKATDDGAPTGGDGPEGDAAEGDAKSDDAKSGDATSADAKSADTTDSSAGGEDDDSQGDDADHGRKKDGAERAPDRKAEADEKASRLG
ncbi:MULTISPECIES: hypothetical protein [unclassified Isoptericola]|uniref:hypothetical protein n=1 Tax=unclassified Isoptericola TaxID=2623355 RepID=UPI003651CF1A